MEELFSGIRFGIRGHAKLLYVNTAELASLDQLSFQQINFLS